MSAARVATAVKFCLVNSCKISHFGINPVRGGSPPRERRRRGVSAVSVGAFVQAMDRVLMLVALLNLNRMKVE